MISVCSQVKNFNCTGRIFLLKPKKTIFMPKGYSLHIGVNQVDQTHYKDRLSPLVACENDAQYYYDLSKNIFKYAHSGLLLSKTATSSAVITAIQTAASKLEAGDIFFLTYSGHRSQLQNIHYDKDTLGDEPTDQTWCLYDRMLIDDEIYEAFLDFKAGVRICVISDSCHSGTVTRDLGATFDQAFEEQLKALMDQHGIQSRSLKSGIAQQLFQVHANTYVPIYDRVKKQLVGEVVARVKLFAACQDTQIAFDGERYSRFTSAVKRIMDKGTWHHINGATFYQQLKNTYHYPTPNFYEYGGANPLFDQQFPFVIDQVDTELNSTNNSISPTAKHVVTSPQEIAETYISGATVLPDVWEIAISSETIEITKKLIAKISPIPPKTIIISDKKESAILTYSAEFISSAWDLVHAIDKRATAANLDLDIEPTISEHFPTTESALNQAKASGAGSGYMARWPPILTGITAFPLGWHTADTHSQLERARNDVWVEVENKKLEGDIKIAHLDTGWAPNHPALKENPFIQKELAKSFVEKNNPLAEDFDTGKGQQWHGTGTLTILAGRRIPQDDVIEKEIRLFGAIPFAKVIPMRIADGVIILNSNNFYKAIEYAIETGCEVVSMSMGGKPSRKMAKAINMAYQNGITVVTAGGNCIVKGLAKVGPKTLVYPARFKRVIAACGVAHNHLPYDFKAQKKYGQGAKSISDTSWMQGNWGPSKVMDTALAAYTPNILWAEKSTADPLKQFIVKKNGGGTSSATPQIAAAAALWLIKHRKTLEEKGYRGTWKQVEAVKHALFSSANKEAFKGYETDYLTYSHRYYGNGILKAHDALNVGVIEVTEAMQAPLARASKYGIKEALGLIFKRKQKSIDSIELPDMPTLEQEFHYHVLNNGRSQELVDLLMDTPNDSFLLAELIDLLQQERLSNRLKQWQWQLAVGSGSSSGSSSWQ